MTLNKDTNFAFFSENKGLNDITTKTYAELKELLDRQNNILSNKSLINNLKDKGGKVRKLRNEILQELNSRKRKDSIGDSIKQLPNSTAVEWKEIEAKSYLEECDSKETDVKTDAFQILAENGLIPKPENKSHITRLIEKETEPNFSFKPYASAVAEKIKNVVPDAHTAKACPTLIKTVHLDESLNLLSQQMSALKILGARRKRVSECIEDRMAETVHDVELENEEITDEHETKINAGISINVNILSDL